MNLADLRIRIFRHYLLFFLLAVISAVLLFTARGRRDIITFCAWSTGYISFALFALILVIGPANLIRNRKNPLSTYFRRDLGIMAGLLALIHSISGLFVHLRGKMFLYFLKESGSGYTVRLDNFGIANYTGLIAAILITILLITSCDRMIFKLTPGRWKNIQRLSYLMFVFVLIHAFFYWIGGKNNDLLLFFYLPLLLIVIIMQSAGVVIHVTKQQ